MTAVTEDACARDRVGVVAAVHDLAVPDSDHHRDREDEGLPVRDQVPVDR